MGMWVAVLVVTSVLLVPVVGSEPAMAEGPGPSTSARLAGGEAKDAPRRVPQKPAAGPAEKTTASPTLERAARPERDSRVLNLLWLLTTSSRR
jgi:hypothetical protein